MIVGFNAWDVLRLSHTTPRANEVVAGMTSYTRDYVHVTGGHFLALSKQTYRPNGWYAFRDFE